MGLYVRYTSTQVIVSSIDMNQLKVFNPKKVRENIEKDQAEGVNTTFVIDVKEPPKGKTYQCVFLKNQIKMRDEAKPAGAILRLGDLISYVKLDTKAAAGALTEDEQKQYTRSYIEVTKGPNDPAAKMEEEEDDKKGKEGGKPRKPTFATTVSKSGDFGYVMDQFDRTWVKRIDELRQGDSPAINEAKTNPILQRKISPKNKNLDKEGKPLKNKPIEDPIIRQTLDFEKYPAEFFLKFLAGKPRTEIYDFATLYTDAKGLPAFKAAVVEIRDPESGNVIRTEAPSDANIYKLIDRGTRIVDGRSHFDTSTESNYGVSTSKLAGRIVIDNRYRVDDSSGGETMEEYDEEALAAVAARVAAPPGDGHHHHRTANATALATANATALATANATVEAAAATANATANATALATANATMEAAAASIEVKKPAEDPNIEALIGSVMGGL